MRLLFITLLFTASFLHATEKRAYFAGGCFWCMEEAFESVDGVSEVYSGYTDGNVPNPSYHQVSSGATGHTEAVEVVYDPEKVSYEQLLQHFWANHDPTRNDGQFCDNGKQYRPGIFTQGDAEQKAAEASKLKIESSGLLPSPVVTEISPASTFYRAENYHQDYYKKNPYQYKFYKWNCGRASLLMQLGLDKLK